MAKTGNMAHVDCRMYIISGANNGTIDSTPDPE